MTKFCFIILHYNVIKETENCISSILSLHDYEQVKIIVVDNCSPNGSGIQLMKKYEGNEQITVLLNQRNEGFSRGNNLGCEYAIEKYHPQFLIVTNNDVEFRQKNTLELILKEYEKNAYDILAVDIYNPQKEVHQNPLGKDCPSIGAINKTIKLNKIFLKYYRFLYPIVLLYFSKKARDSEYKTYQQNVVPMGACLIFSNKMYEDKKKIFDPETNFYYEEYILTHWCITNQKKIVYTPNIQVFHLEGKATATWDEKNRKKIKLKMEHTLHAAKIYRELLKKK